MENQQQQQQQTGLCRSGCGFYGSPVTEGLCSKCFKDSIKRKQEIPHSTTTATVNANAQQTNMTSIPMIELPTLSPTTAASADSISAASTSMEMSGVVGAALAGAVATTALIDSISTNAQQQQPSIDHNNHNVHHQSMEADAINMPTMTLDEGSAIPAPVQNMPGDAMMIIGDAVLMTARDSSTSLSSTISSTSSADASSATNVASAIGQLCSATSALPMSGGAKKSRCQMCKKRVGLTGFVCRCGGMYCGEHRYDNAHNCTFDYKTMEREEIRKNNPVVVSEKIRRI